MGQRLRSTMIFISALQHFSCLSLESILKSRHFNIFKGNNNYHSNDKLPQGQTFFYDSYDVQVLRGYAFGFNVYKESKDK